MCVRSPPYARPYAQDLLLAHIRLYPHNRNPAIPGHCTAHVINQHGTRKTFPPINVSAERAFTLTHVLIVTSLILRYSLAMQQLTLLLSFGICTLFLTRKLFIRKRGYKGQKIMKQESRGLLRSDPKKAPRYKFLKSRIKPLINHFGARRVHYGSFFTSSSPIP